jgi:hypothetical protein
MQLQSDQFSRGAFGEIQIWTLAADVRKAVTELVVAVATGRHVDEHGAWKFGAEFDKNRRGEALNWDLYALGHDIHDGGQLAVVQARQYRRQKTNWWPSIRKNYYLIGRNEDGAAFAHPVEAIVVRAAIAKGRDPVLAVQGWLWQTDYATVTRQGDIALVPRQTRPPRVQPVYGPVVVEGAHLVLADEIVSDGKRLFARAATLIHLRGTHPDVAAHGWTTVVTARRAASWAFAAPTVD